MNANTSPPEENRKLKIILSIFAGLFLLGACCVGTGVYFVQKNMGEVVEKGRETREAAMAFAQSHDQDDCIPESMSRYADCEGFVCETSAGVFARACLEAAAPTEGICEAVPHPLDLTSSVKWRIAFCERMGRKKDPKCLTQAAFLQNHCSLPGSRQSAQPSTGLDASVAPGVDPSFD